jgi:PAS domain S-box-containing protein
MKQPATPTDRYSQIIGKLQIGVFEYTLFSDGRKDFTYISPYCEKILETSSEELMGGLQPMISHVIADDQESFSTCYHRSLARLESFRWEGRIVTTLESPKWIEAIADPAKMEDGRVVWVGTVTDITDRKEMEQSSRESKHRLDLALKGSELGVWDYNYQTNSTVINEKWAELIGYPKAELEEMFGHCEDFVHQEDRPNYIAIIDNHLKKKTDFYEVVYRFQLKEGGWRWVMERGQVVEFDVQGKPLRTVGTLQNFENRKIQEQLALEAESRYRQLIDALPIGVGIHQKGILVYANNYAAKILGAQSNEELIGKEVTTFVHPSSLPATLERLKVLAQGNPVPIVEQQFIRLDGQAIYVEVDTHHCTFKGAPAIQSVVRDITPEWEVRLGKLRSETLFSQLFKSSPFGLVMLDEKGYVVQLNDGFEKMFGYTIQELEGKSLNDFIVPQELEAEGNDLNTLITSEQVVKIETYRLHKDKSHLSVLVYGVPVPYDNKTISIFGVYVDITARKKVEEELKVRNIELDNFVYKVSHDLRAPLSSVLGLVNLAKMEGNDDSLADYMKLIGQKVQQLDHFISDVLSHSKNLKLDIKIKKIDLQKLIEQTYTSLNYLKGAEQIKKKIEIEGADFYSDPWRIAEILRNLVSNSIKYRDFNRADPEINININIGTDTAVILFVDNGIGISQPDLNKIFEMFYRASTQSDGSGLGLYIVKNAVDKLGGILKVSSELRKGTTFELRLPNHPAKSVTVES